MLGLPWNKIYSMKILQQNHLCFDPSIWSYEDEIFVVKYIKCIKKAVTSSVATYYHIARGNLTLSVRYIDLPLHFRIADILYEDGLAISSHPDYLAHLDTAYTHHLSESIGRLYWKHLHFTKSERLENIALILEKARERGKERLLKEQLRKRWHLRGNTPEQIDRWGCILKRLSPVRKILMLPFRLLRNL